ncbi:MAG: hypothetical protein A2X64_02435 [Ignavibacteria bacterium GWF2_33_9]|nr:MAG: hypothetical protein A2X64_02435 [Ignavibacteria bacterium GWF2_33_9]
MNKIAVFLDRDGIVNERIIDDYVKTIDDFVFIEDFFETFRIIHDFGALTFLVTNQQGVGKKLMTVKDLSIIHNQMNLILKKKCGANFTEIFFCPSLDEDNDFRRKPNPGMILEAIEKYKLIPEKCIIIGDSKSDILSGKSAKIKTIYIGEVNSEVSSSDYKFKNHKELNSNLEVILSELLL